MFIPKVALASSYSRVCPLIQPYKTIYSSDDLLQRYRRMRKKYESVCVAMFELYNHKMLQSKNEGHSFKTTTIRKKPYRNRLISVTLTASPLMTK